ncbi:MAG: FHA domain-containing protein [Pseudomonadota bacterium]
MKFLSDLFGRKKSGPKPDEPSIENFADVAARADSSDAPLNTDDLLNSVNAKVGEKSQKNNIWDMDVDVPSLDGLEEMAPAPAAKPSRSRRTKTRLIGFESTDGVVDLFNDTQSAKPAKGTKFPVGWVVVTDGPGRGESFTLVAGMSQIGRGEDQAIQLDFGDTAISRTNHAAIVYDAENHSFLLGHGGKSNVVRLNDTPVISNEAIKDGDLIRIGETTLRFTQLCDETFNWTDKNDGDEESDDVAIA